MSLLGCSPRALHEAKRVVAEADSMRAEGRMYDDSLALAQAYGTLGHWQWFYADEYAHACYHYGRLLRAKDNPVSAMQCFISATHAPTRDYPILGRVYSNMGDIAHLAGEFALAYDMYERSAEMYLRNGDTLLYNYGLYSMAFELAEQGREEETFAILQKIRQECAIRDVLSLADYTQAVLNKNTERYDSAIYYAQRAQTCPMCYADAILIMAQSYSYLGAKDSAVYYANLVVASSTKLYHINNALYILTNDDEESNKETIRETAADRADAQKLLEIRQGKLAQAAQLLEQDLTRKPNLLWLYAIIATLSIVGLIIGLYIWHKRKKHALLVQKIDDLEHAASTVREKHLELSNLYTSNQNRIKEDILSKCDLLRKSSNIPKELSWNNFESMCEIVDQRFYMLASKLRQKHILNETEIRLCILVFLNMSRSEISDTLPYALNSVGKLKDHTSKLLGTTGRNLHDFLLNMAIQG